MTKDQDFEIFLAAPPGLEAVLHDEVRGKGFRQAKAVPGGVTIRGGWPEVWRANLWVRGAGRVLASSGRSVMARRSLAVPGARARRFGLKPW